MSAVTASNVIDGFFKTKLLHEIKLVTNPCSVNQGTKLSGSSNKHPFVFPRVGSENVYNYCLPWLGAEGTLLKEFEKKDSSARCFC